MNIANSVISLSTSDPGEIKSYLMKWIMREWEIDHNEAPGEHWTVKWMTALPNMDLALQTIHGDTEAPRKSY